MLKWIEEVKGLEGEHACISLGRPMAHMLRDDKHLIAYQALAPRVDKRAIRRAMNPWKMTVVSPYKGNYDGS